MVAKFVGLAEHVQKCVGDMVTLNNDLLTKCQEKVASKVGLESGNSKCNTHSDVISLKM